MLINMYYNDQRRQDEFKNRYLVLVVVRDNFLIGHPFLVVAVVPRDCGRRTT